MNYSLQTWYSEREKGWDAHISMCSHYTVALSTQLHATHYISSTNHNLPPTSFLIPLTTLFASLTHSHGYKKLPPKKPHFLCACSNGSSVNCEKVGSESERAFCASVSVCGNMNSERCVQISADECVSIRAGLNVFCFFFKSCRRTFSAVPVWAQLQGFLHHLGIGESCHRVPAGESFLSPLVVHTACLCLWASQEQTPLFFHLSLEPVHDIPHVLWLHDI